MQPTLDSVPGTWTLWVRMKAHPTTVHYQAVFTASAPGATEGTVTVTGGPSPCSGTWKEKVSDEKENVKFTIPDPAGSGKEFKFRGYMVGGAMGGYIDGHIGPLDTAVLRSPGDWAAHKTSD